MESLCLSLFSKNLNYFQDNYLEIYKKIINFKELLDTNKISQRYELRYENQTFYIFDLTTNLIFNKTNPSIKTIIPISTEVFDNNFLKSQSFTPENTKSIDNLKKLIDPTKFDFLAKQKTKASKFIFIGIDISHKFIDTIDKVNCNYYMIIEPDIELFYLSLFTIEYTKIAANKKIIFSILDNDEIITKKLEEFYNLDFSKNHIYQYIENNNSYKFIFNTISTFLFNINPLKYTYSSMLNDIKQKNINIKKYKTLDLNKNNLKNKSILILSSGPSIQNNIKKIKKYKDKFIIIAFAQTLKLLEKYNLKPDIVTIIDSSKRMENYFKLSNKRFLNKVKLFANNTVYPNIFSYFKQKNVYLFDKKEDNLFGITVGETTYHLALKLKVKSIYFLGVDLAFDKKNNAYEENHISNNSTNNCKYLTTKEDPLSSIINVKGNLRDTVDTNIFFKQLIENYNYISNTFNLNNIKVYNLSDGAYLDNTIKFTKYKKLSNLKKLNKKIKLNTKKLKVDKKLSKDEISHIDKLLIDNIFSKNINTKYQFLLSLNTIVQTTLTIDTSNIYSIHRQHICYNYFNITLNFINYIIYSNFEFNYNKVFQLLSNQLKTILEEFTNTL